MITHRLLILGSIFENSVLIHELLELLVVLGESLKVIKGITVDMCAIP